MKFADRRARSVAARGFVDLGDDTIGEAETGRHADP
ncbi:MAG: hypothetical protein JWP75_396, partial [Frondihabitans sp.]|nr:hypothetical protein [Frondihabitans sp.]